MSIRLSPRLSLITFLILLFLASLSPCKAAPWSFDTDKLITQARSQIGITVSYDPAYRILAYPGGDVPMETGVCTDVVIRALRAFSIDLQKEVHEDMASHFSKYPRRWKLTRPDKNIDHRRVPNLMVFFERRGCELPISDNPNAYRPGDLVTCLVNGTLPHIMIVSNRKSASGTPLVIHNIGRGAQEEDILFQYKITGHYRISEKS